MTSIETVRQSGEEIIAEPPVLEIKALSIGHGAQILLENINFSLSEGCLAVLTGPNGRGKTTLFRTILGLHPSISGVIQILGRDMDARPNPISYLPQSRRVPMPQLTAIDHVKAAWRGKFLGPINVSSSCRADVARVMSLAGASPFAHRPMGLLSGGEKQRVFLAIALLDHPKILILDEPMTSVDAKGQEQIAMLLSKLCRELRLTILASTHHPEPFHHVPHVALKLTHHRLEQGDA